MSVNREGETPGAGGFVRGLGLGDATMMVAGSMIGSGIFIVSADIARVMGSPGWLLAVWLGTGALTIIGALAYGELAAMMPEAGGQYVFLREAYSPFWGFLYGWALFLVIQTGTIAAVAVAFARFLGLVVPAISPTAWILKPMNLSAGYALSLSWQQAVGIAMVVLLTYANTHGLALGKLVQNVFTSTKTLTLIAIVVIGLILGSNAGAIKANFSNLWAPHGAALIRSDLGFVGSTSASAGLFGLFVAFCVAQVGSLFSADAWNNVTFAAAEVKEPRRTLPRALFLGTGLVIALYLLANIAYVVALPLDAIQHAPDDRVGTALLARIYGDPGALIAAVAIVISTFGCANGLILAGARVYYAMARDGVFFRATGLLNRRHVPAVGLWLQCVWTCVLILPRTRLRDAVGAPLRDAATGMEQYGNLYSNLLDYVVFAVLVFYVLTIVALFVLRRTRPAAERPYRAFGYPWLPAFYIFAASVIALVLVLYRTQTTWPGLAIVLSGVPAYLLWRRLGAQPAAD
jgi:basic amino acid/polyamine antiporter, APA family